MYGSKLNQSQFKSYPDCNTDGTQAFLLNLWTPETDKLKHFYYSYLKNLTVAHMKMVSMAQVVERKTGNPKVQGSQLTPNILKLHVFLGMVYLLI